MKDPYLFCYLMGRSVELDAGANKPLVAKVEAGAPLRDVVMDAAREAWSPSAAYKMRWLKDNQGAIKSAGGDTEKAWALYTQGRIDALAQELEGEVLSKIDEPEWDDDDDDEDDEDDEDEDDEDDDEGDDDDEEGMAH